MELKILNLACGANRITGAINCDMEPRLKPDMVLDVRNPLPFETNSIDKIIFSHAIEHIERDKREGVLQEFYRVLKPEGTLFISYPEFEKIVRGWLDNLRGNRVWWELTIYGGQRYPGDYHLAIIHTPYLISELKEVGFKNIKGMPEPDQDFNTMILCSKGEPMDTREDVLRKEIFG